MSLALQDDWPTQLDRFVFVELTGLQQNPEVLEEGRCLPGSYLDALEAGYGVGGTQDTAGGFGGYLGGL